MLRTSREAQTDGPHQLSRHTGGVQAATLGTIREEPQKTGTGPLVPAAAGVARANPAELERRVPCGSGSRRASALEEPAHGRWKHKP